MSNNNGFATLLQILIAILLFTKVKFLKGRPGNVIEIHNLWPQSSDRVNSQSEFVQVRLTPPMSRIRNSLFIKYLHLIDTNIVF